MKYRYRENGAEATALLFLSKSPSTSTYSRLLSVTLVTHLTFVSCDSNSSKCKCVHRVLKTACHNHLQRYYQPRRADTPHQSYNTAYNSAVLRSKRVRSVGFHPRSHHHHVGYGNQIKSSKLIVIRRRVTISIQTIDAPQLNLDKDFVSEDFGAEMKIADLKDFIESETRVPSAAQRLFYNGTELHDGSKTLQQCQIVEDSMLGLQVRNPQTASSIAARPMQGQARRAQSAGAGQRGQAQDPEYLRLQALGNPALLENMRHQQPGLADAVQDPARFKRAYEDSIQQYKELEAEKARKLELLSADPMNPEAQAQIEEIIRLEAVVDNLHTAMEHNPEGEYDFVTTSPFQ